MANNEDAIDLMREVARLTSALAEAQAREAALKGEVDRHDRLRRSEVASADRAWERTAAAEAERDAAVKRAEEAERFQLDAEKAYCGSAVFFEVLEFFEKAGCGKPGTPNTVWAMTQEIIRRAEAAESKLTLAERVVELAGPAVQALNAHLCLGECCAEGRTARDKLDSALSEYRKAVGR